MFDKAGLFHGQWATLQNLIGRHSQIVHDTPAPGSKRRQQEDVGIIICWWPARWPENVNAMW